MTSNFPHGKVPLEHRPDIDDQRVVDQLRAEARRLARGEDDRRAMRRFRAGFSIED